MTQQDSPELAEKRAAVGRAIQEFAALQQSSLHEREGYYVFNWAVSFEGSTPELERDEKALTGVIVPDGQNMTTSTGLMRLGERHWA